MKLNDPQIRVKLKEFLLSSRIKPRAILEELHVHKGNAIADVVAVYNEPHCFEIKGENDNINRLLIQGQFYDLCFKKITLVTTKNHLEKAVKTIPLYWGIMLASCENNRTKLKYYRKSKNNPIFKKEIALYTLWRQEMFDIGTKCDLLLPKKINKGELALEIANKLTQKEVNTSIAKSLINRTIYQNH